MNIVIFGASGLLGSARLGIFNKIPEISAVGTFRSKYNFNQFPYKSE